MRESIDPFIFSDATSCLRRVYTPDAPPRARLVMLHGIISHGGWYRLSCQVLANEGFEVHFLDRRGSGLNPQSRGDARDHQIWVSDVCEFLQSLGEDLPRLLVGISWGGKLAVEVAKRYPNLIDGLALICPGIYARQFPPPWKYAAMGLLSKIGLGRIRVPIPLRDPALFTNVPQWQRFIAADHQTLRKVTIRFGLADRNLTQLARTNPQSLDVPTWMVLAGQDRICDNDALKHFFDSIGTSNKHLTEYPDATHTFEFEPDPSAYFRDLVHWVRGVCQSSDAGRG